MIAFIEFWNNMDYFYKIIEVSNPNKKSKVLILFDDMVADMLSNKNLNPIVTEFFIRGRKPNISLVFITQKEGKIQENFLNSIHGEGLKISTPKQIL